MFFFLFSTDAILIEIYVGLYNIDRSVIVLPQLEMCNLLHCVHYQIDHEDHSVYAFHEIYNDKTKDHLE